MPKYEKRSYRTMQGLWSALMHKNDGWTKRRNEDLTNLQSRIDSEQLIIYR